MTYHHIDIDHVECGHSVCMYRVKRGLQNLKFGLIKCKAVKVTIK